MKPICLFSQTLQPASLLKRSTFSFSYLQCFSFLDLYINKNISDLYAEVNKSTHCVISLIQKIQSWAAMHCNIAIFVFLEYSKLPDSSVPYCQYIKAQWGEAQCCLFFTNTTQYNMHERLGLWNKPSLFSGLSVFYDL